MELIEALRTTPSVRQFTSEPVDDELIFKVLDDARFAPSGGNRQAWHVIVVRDPVVRQAVRDTYLEAWHDYVAHLLAGLIPFSPLASDDDRASALSQLEAAKKLSTPNGFPENLDSVPVMLVVCADLEVLAATDRDLDRYQIAGGASIYPFVWNILLSAREHGLGGVMTTVAMRREQEVRQALNMPVTFALASVMALGYPATHVTKLSRRPVESFTTRDTFDGEPFEA
jgi:nitroreductase